jgi:hypothetical protein
MTSDCQNYQSPVLVSMKIIIWEQEPITFNKAQGQMVGDKLVKFNLLNCNFQAAGLRNIWKCSFQGETQFSLHKESGCSRLSEKSKNYINFNIRNQ